MMVETYPEEGNRGTDTRKAEKYLDQWGRWVRWCDAVNMSAGSSLDNDPKGFQELGFEEDVDHLVSDLINPFKRLIMRHYVDPRPVRHEFYPIGRIIADKAKTERMSIGQYKNGLQIARCIFCNGAVKFSWWIE